MDAKTLFQEGVVAIRDQKDSAKGRELLMQSLKIEPKNELAWLWLSRTMPEPQKKIQCLERALKLNPSNEQTKALISKLSGSAASAPSAPEAVVKTPAQPKAAPPPPPPQKSDTGDWGALRMSTNEMDSLSQGGLTNPQVSAEMEDMGLTPDLGHVLNVTSEMRAASKPAPVKRASTTSSGIKDLRAVYGDEENAPATAKPTPQKSDSGDWGALRISTSEMEAISQGGLTSPQVSADMEDMGLTPDLGHVLSATSEMRSPSKRAATTTSTGIKDLRAVYGEAEAEESTPEAAEEPAKPSKPSLTNAETTQIKNFLTQAQSLLNKNKIEEAIEQWVRVLEIEVDNEAALGNAVRYLSRLKYIDDARELVWNALDSGTTHPSIYLTAIDIAKYQGQEGEADDLRLKLVQLPEAGEKTVFSVVDHFVEKNPQKALQALDYAIPFYPKSQKLTFRRAQLAEELGLRKEAAIYYEEAAQLGTRSKEGQLADKKLTEFMPHMTDKERGSFALAFREALGIGFLYLLMAFQDAGLNLLQLGANRIAGIGMSIIGGYLLITATSSPQQKRIAAWFGGSVPVPKPKVKDAAEKTDVVKEIMGEPEEEPTQLPIIPLAIRVVLAIAGIVILVAAFVLVFNAAIALLRSPEPKPFYVPTIEDLIKDQ